MNLGRAGLDKTGQCGTGIEALDGCDLDGRLDKTGQCRTGIEGDGVASSAQLGNGHGLRGGGTEGDNVTSSAQARKVAAFAAFVCFFATLPIYSPNIVAINAAGVPEVTAWFAQGVLGFSLLSVVLTFVPGGQLHTARHGSPLFFAFYFIGVAGYIALVALGADVSSPVVNALGLVCSLFAGLPLATLCANWAAVFFGKSLMHLTLTCGLGIAAAATLNLGVSALPAPLSFLLHGAMLAVGTFAPLALKKVEAASLQVDAELSPNRAHAKAFFSVMGAPLLGIALSSFVIGIAPTTVLNGLVDTQVLGSIAAGLVVAIACGVASHDHIPAAAFAQRLLIPIAAALVMALCMFPGASPDAQIIAAYTLFSIVGAIALAMGSGISNAREFPRDLVFSTIIGTYCLTAVLGLALGSQLSDTSIYHSGIVMALTAAYGVFTVANACLHAQRGSSNDMSDEDLLSLSGDDGTAGVAPGSASDSAYADEASDNPASTLPVEARVTLLANRFALTPRETEIVQILARGHGCSYVAETLLISKSTVYTHVRNVYRKLDVSCHDELIARIYEQGN